MVRFERTRLEDELEARRAVVVQWVERFVRARAKVFFANDRLEAFHSRVDVVAGRVSPANDDVRRNLFLIFNIRQLVF